jgi:hypothetical protein
MAKRCFGNALLHIPCLLESVLVFVMADAIGGETDTECSLADGGVDTLDGFKGLRGIACSQLNCWIVVIGSIEHLVVSGGCKRPLDAIPVAFGSVESTASSKEKSFPALGQLTH